MAIKQVLGGAVFLPNARMPGFLALAFLVSFFCLAGCAGGNGGEQGIGQQGLGQSGLAQASMQESQKTVSGAVAFLAAKYSRQDVPQASIITNVAELQKTKRAIYANARDGMVLVLWPDLLVIYDPASNAVVTEMPLNTFEG